MIVFLIADVVLLGVALVCIAMVRSQFLLNRIAHFCIIAAMSAGLVFTFYTFTFPAPKEISLFTQSSLGNISLSIDKLSLFFLAIIQMGGIVSSLYGIGYLSHYETNRSLKPTITASVFLFFSMQIILLSNHAILFLVAWELMALSGYLGIILEREDTQVQHGSLIFFAATHIGTLSLYVMFLVLHQQTGSWEFSVFAQHPYPPAAVTSIFWFGFIGFGMKAGFMPFHFWLPEAHPVAPSHISAVLSAVMLKIGIYGLLRVILWVNPTDYIIPTALIVISSLTAVFGIWNALAQKDFKRMLAYSSIENIGIIGIALSLIIFGMQNNRPMLIFLGLSGALFHSLNHFIIKSLLFMGAGTIYHHYHHRDIERMGGLLNSTPFFGSMMLIGAIAICGIPPFNGFASEFLLYSGFFEASQSLQAYFPFFMLISAVALAFVGGLAVVAFSKVFSMIFLGSPKETQKKIFSISGYELVSLLLLTLMILTFGIFPQAVMLVTGNIFHELYPEKQFLPGNFSIRTIHFIGSIAIATIVCIVIIAIVKQKFISMRSTRIIVPWGCGYNKLNPRMQYSGTSFSDDIVNIAGKALYVEKEIRLPKNVFPQSSSFQTNEGDYVLQKIITPVDQVLLWFIERFKWLQSGEIQIYITFSIVIVLFYLFLAFQW
jgi:hydrogenase-4 component B